MTEHAQGPGPDGMKRGRLTTITIEGRRCPAYGGVKLRKYRTLGGDPQPKASLDG